MAELLKSVTDRSRGIGGSDAASIFGLSKWTPLPKLWLEKTGRLFKQPETENEENELFEWGKYLEAPIARKYSQRTGRKIRRPRATFSHPDYPWMIGNPDREQWDNARPKTDRRGALEVKNAMLGKLREWSKEGVPAQYYLQLQHYLAIMGLSWGSFAVLFGGNKLVKFDIPRDDKLITLMIDKEREFWGYVERDQPPPMELGAEWNEMLVNFFPKPKQEAPLKLDTPEALGRAYRLITLKDSVKTREAEIAKHEAYFKALLADHASCIVGGKVKISWTPGDTSRVDIDKLRKEHAEIARALTVTKPTRRFTVTPLETLPAMEEAAEETAPLIVSARRIDLD